MLKSGKIFNKLTIRQNVQQNIRIFQKNKIGNNFSQVLDQIYLNTNIVIFDNSVWKLFDIDFSKIDLFWPTFVRKKRDEILSKNSRRKIRQKIWQFRPIFNNVFQKIWQLWTILNLDKIVNFLSNFWTKLCPFFYKIFDNGILEPS